MAKEKEKSSGLRSAVRMGELTPDEALAKLKKWGKKSGYVSPELVAWLKRQNKMKKA